MSNSASAALAAVASSDGETDVIERSLAFVRRHLGMEVAYLSEFVGDDLVFRALDAPGFEEMAQVGSKMPLDAVYCRHILDGRLPELIADTSEIPFAQEVPITNTLPVGAHVSIPIRRADGTPYGMFCCLSRTPNPSLNARDLEVMRVFADLSAEHVRNSLEVRSRLEGMRERLDNIIASDGLQIHYQPIVDFQTRTIAGLEALSRFRSEPYVPPNVWFAEAGEIGVALDLELAAIRAALPALDRMPEDVYLSVNASPATVESGRLVDVFAPYEMSRILLEVTEHEEPTDPGLFHAELLKLRKQAVRLAIDDMGAGYSGLQQVVALQPDVIKLDIALVKGVDRDLVRRSLASALVHFAVETGARLVAEGVESEDELASLRELGVGYGQGYLLGRPAALDDIFNGSKADRASSA